VQAVRFVEPQIVHAYLLQVRKPISKKNVHRWVWHWHCSASCKVTSQRYQCSCGSRCACCCRGYGQFLVYGIEALVQRCSQGVLAACRACGSGRGAAGTDSHGEGTEGSG
jgi:hypothetical protein